MTLAYIGLGSNLGDRRGHIEAALERLARLPHSRLRGVSSVIETEPAGLAEQPRFLNAVAVLETDLTPHDLLAELQEIEADLGRVRTRRWGPRTIDLDILLYGDFIINSEHLTIPHPRMTQRRFVLEPLVEVAPEARHPVLGRTAAQLLADLERTSDAEAGPKGAQGQKL